MTDTTPDPGDQLTSFIESLYDGVRPPDSDDVALVYDLVHDLRERVAVAVQHGFREGASQVAHDRDDKAANEWEAGYQACYERMQAEGRLLPAAGRAAPRAEGLDVERLLEDIAARIRSGTYLNYYAGPDNLVRDALDAEYARLSRPSDERVPKSEEPR